MHIFMVLYRCYKNFERYSRHSQLQSNRSLSFLFYVMSSSGTQLPATYDILLHQPQFSCKHSGYSEVYGCDPGSLTLCYTSLNEVTSTHQRAVPNKTSSHNKISDRTPNPPATAQENHTFVTFNNSFSMESNHMYVERIRFQETSEIFNCVFITPTY